MQGPRLIFDGVRVFDFVWRTRFHSHHQGCRARSICLLANFAEEKLRRRKGSSRAQLCTIGHCMLSQVNGMINLDWWSCEAQSMRIYSIPILYDIFVVWGSEPG